MKDYQFKTQYYETDQMGIIHHANYIRWFESARIYWMDQMGYSYKALEGIGIGSPVLSVACEYKAPCQFDETLTIKLTVKKFNGVRLVLGYEVYGASSTDKRAVAETTHAFLNREKQIISLKKEAPAYYEAIKQYQAGPAASDA